MNQVTRMLMAAAIAFSCAGAGLAGTTPLGSSFSYQGALSTGGVPYNGTADFQFTLWELSAGGPQVGGMIPVNLVTVNDGVFSTPLDFGVLAFDGNERWLQIAVRTPAGGAGSFTTLSPRQKIEAVPYALYALNSLISGTQGNAVSFTNAGNTYAGSSMSL